jgi:hypothetical protein
VLLLGGIHFAAGSMSKAAEILQKLIGSQNQLESGQKRNSIVSSDDLDKAIDYIEHDLDQLSLAGSVSDDEAHDDGSDAENQEILRNREKEENQQIVKIERIVERAITLYNSSLFMPLPPPVDKTQRPKNSAAGTKADMQLSLSASILKKNFLQGQRLQQLAMDSLKMFVRKLRNRRSQAYDDKNYDSFERVPWNMCPDILSYDIYMYPAVCWAVLLQANAERYLQNSVQFSQGLRIQRGELVLSTEDYVEQLEAAESFFTKAVQVVEAARFHGGYEAVDDDNSQRGRRTRSLLSKNSMLRDDDAIKSAASNLAAAFGEASATKSSVAVSTPKGVDTKSRHGSTVTRANKRGSAVSAAPSRRVTKMGEATIGTEDKEDLIDSVDEENATVTGPTDAESVIAKMTGMDMHLADTVDTSILKDALLNVKQLISLDSDMRTNRMVVSTANKSLVRQGVTEFNPWTGQLGNNALPSVFPTTNTGAKDDRPVNAVGQMRDSSLPEKKGVHITYNPKKDDPTSMRSEMIPTRAIFGLNEEISWIQWALGAVGGISLGFLGHSCMSVEELSECVSVDSEPKKPKIDSLNETTQASGPRLSESFLVEVRNRLLEVDTKLTLSDEIDVAAEEEAPTSNPNATFDPDNATSGAVSPKKRRGDYLLTLPSGQLETRLILLFILVKVTAELHWKKELLPSLLQLEKSFDILKQRYGASIAYRHELLIYGTMIQKFRLEYDQWLFLSAEVMSEGERAEVLMLQILPRAKKYHQAALDMMNMVQAQSNNPADPTGKDNGQLYLMKDSVKKLTNAYLGIGNIPVKVAPPTSNPTGYGSKKKSTEAAPPVVVIQPLGTLGELERLDDKEIEEKEKNDIKWLQKFGLARAKMVYKKFKEQFSCATQTATTSTVVVSF